MHRRLRPFALPAPALLVTGVLAGLLGGCPEQAPISRPSSAALDEPLTDLPADGTEEGAGPYQIHPARLDKFIAYQEQTLALYQQMLAELGRVEGTDGGAAAAVGLVKKHAQAQEKARRSLGLSERDVRELERVVGDVIARRALAQSLEGEKSLQELEGLAARLSPEQRGEVDKSIAARRAEYAGTLALTEERKKYGDENVDLVLTREEVLTQQWQQAIATFAGSPPRQAPSPSPTGAVTAGATGLEEPATRPAVAEPNGAGAVPAVAGSPAP